MIKVSKIKKLPDAAGVYFFKNKTGKILYVGKATSLRDRVRSYFSNDVLNTRGPLIEQMVNLAQKIDFIQTDSVLEAFILEASLIKKHQPPHNTKDKDDKSFNHVVISNEKFPRVFVARGREVEKFYSDPNLYKAIYGPFPYSGAVKEALKIVRRIFPFRDNKCLSIDQLPPGKTPQPCFNWHIGLCPGVCIGKVTEEDYARTIKHIMMFFEGQKKQLVASLKKDMKVYAKNQEFENANAVKKIIFALQHIQDVALIYKDKGNNLSGLKNRIEAYDIAHISGSATVGVMTVVSDSQSLPAEYRMFKIRQITKGDDLKALGEVLTRRFSHPEWPYPTIIVIDGGQTHLNFAETVLKENNVKVQVVSVVKDQRHKPKDILGNAETIKLNRSAILLANSEAHRFAIKYHKNLRNRNFLQ